MKLLVFSNAREGRDDEFNEWYDTVHLPALVEIPGIVSGTRYRAHAAADEVPEYRYLAIYELSEDAEAVMGEVRTRSANGELGITDSLDLERTKVTVWESLY